MITFVLNGTAITAESGSIEDLVSSHIGSDVGVAVAINSAVLPRSQWSRQIEDADCIDILTAVQGG